MFPWNILLQNSLDAVASHPYLGSISVQFVNGHTSILREAVVATKMGRATVSHLTRADREPCHCCGSLRDATMYKITLSTVPGGVSQLVWVLCCTCREHLFSAAESYNRLFDDIY